MNNFSTSDFNLAVTLSALGFQIEGVDRSNPRRAEFIFNANEKLNETVEKFWRDQLAIEPKKLFYQMKMLKARLFSLGGNKFTA